MKKLSKLLALLLTVCMVFSMLPTFAFAEDAPAVAADAALVEEAASDVAPEAEAPAIDDVELEALELEALELQDAGTRFTPATKSVGKESAIATSDPVYTYYKFASEQEAADAGMKVHYLSNDGKTHDCYFTSIAVALAYSEKMDSNSNATTKPCTLKLLDDFIVDDDYGYKGNGNWGSFETASHQYDTMRRSTIIDLNDHTMTMNQNRNIFAMGTNQTITLELKNGTIFQNNTASGRGVVVCGTSHGVVGTSTGAVLKPTITFNDVRIYCTSSSIAFASYWFGSTFIAKNNTEIYCNSGVAFQLHKSDQTGEVKVNGVNKLISETDYYVDPAEYAPVAELSDCVIASGNSKYAIYAVTGSTIKVGDNIAVYNSVDIGNADAKTALIGKLNTGSDGYEVTAYWDNSGTTTAKAFDKKFYKEMTSDIASYTPNGGKETVYGSLTEAVKAAMDDKDATSTTPHGKVTLLADVDITDETGIGKSGATGAVFENLSKALEMDLNGYTVTNNSTVSFFRYKTSSPKDICLKVYNGKYAGTKSDGRTFVALCTTSENCLGFTPKIELKDMTIYSCGSNGATISSYAGQADITLDNCKIYHGGKNEAVKLGIAATADQQTEPQTAAYAPRLTLKNNVKLGSATGYGLSIATKFAASPNAAIQNPDPELILDGAVEIYGNKADAESAVEGYDAYEALFDDCIVETVTTGWALDKNPKETTGAANAVVKSIVASYTTVAGVTTTYGTFDEAVKAAYADPDATPALAGEIKLLRDWTIEPDPNTKGYDESKGVLPRWIVGQQGNGCIANDKKQVAIDLNLNGHVLTNNTSANLIFLCNVGSEIVKIHDGTYVGTGARALVAICGTTTEEAYTSNQKIYLTNLNAISAKGNMVSSYAGQSEIYVKDSLLVTDSSYVISLGNGGSEADCKANDFDWKPTLTIEDSTIVCRDNYDIGISKAFDNKAYNDVELANKKQRVYLKGNVFLYHNKDKASAFTNASVYDNDTFIHSDYVKVETTNETAPAIDKAGKSTTYTGLKKWAYEAAELASGTCGTGLTWKLDSDGNLEIKGEGAMDAADPNFWTDNKTQIKTVTIGDKVASIAASAFDGCTALTTVTILNGDKTPTALAFIGADAFKGCTATLCFPRIEEMFAKVTGYDTLPISVTVQCVAACIGDAHKYTAAAVTTEPTCTEPGESTAECIICGNVKSTPLSAQGHDFKPTGEYITEPTCYLPGVGKMQCSRCTETDTMPVPATGHTFGEDGICTSCGAHHFTPTKNDGKTVIQSVGRSTAWDSTKNAVEKLAVDDPLYAYFDFPNEAEAVAAGMRVHYRSYNGTHDHYFMDLAVAFSYSESLDKESNAEKNPCTVTLLDDLDLDHELWYAGNANVAANPFHKFATMRRSTIVDLNGHTMEANGNYNVFSVGTNANITLTVKNGTVIHKNAASNRGFVVCGDENGEICTSNDSGNALYAQKVTIDSVTYISTNKAPIITNYWYQTQFILKDCTVYTDKTYVLDINRSDLTNAKYNIPADATFAPQAFLENTKFYCGYTDEPLQGAEGAVFHINEGTEIYCMANSVSECTIKPPVGTAFRSTAGEYVIRAKWDGSTESEKTLNSLFALSYYGTPEPTDETYFTFTSGNTTYYYTVDDFVEVARDAAAEDTITLYKDLGSVLTMDSGITLDLAGHTVAGLNVTGADITVKNGAVCSTDVGITVTNAASLNLNHCDVVASGNALDASGAVVTLTNCTLEGGTSGTGYAVNAAQTSTISLNDTTLAASNDYAICCDETSTVYFNSGVVYVPCTLFDNNSRKWFDGTGVQYKVDETSLYRNSQQRIIRNNATGEQTKGSYYCVTTDAPVAKIGNIAYRTLNEALNAAKDGDTITLYADTDVEKEIAAMPKAENGNIFQINKSVTIDLNGNTVTGTKAGVTSVDKILFRVSKSNGAVTIKNGKINSPSTAYYAIIGDPTNTTLNLIDVSMVTGYRGVYATTGAGESYVINIVGGSYVGLSTSASNCVIQNGGKAVYNISGGTKIAQNNTGPAYVAAGGTMNIADATIYSKSESGINAIEGSFLSADKGETVPNATFENFATGSVKYAYATTYLGEPELTASYNDTSMALKDALNAATSGTVTLLKDVTLKEAMTVQSGVTLDLNGHTLDFDGGKLTVASGATLKAAKEADLQSKGNVEIQSGATLCIGEQTYNATQNRVYDYRLNVQKVSLSMKNQVVLNVKLSKDAGGMSIDDFTAGTIGTYAVFSKAVAPSDYGETWQLTSNGASGLPYTVGVEAYAQKVLADTSAKASLKTMLLAMLQYGAKSGATLSDDYAEQWATLKTEPTWTDPTCASGSAETESFGVTYNGFTGDMTVSGIDFYNNSFTKTASASFTLDTICIPEVAMQLNITNGENHYIDTFASYAKANGSDALKAAVIFGEYANAYFSGK